MMVMKKPSVFWVILIVLAVILVASFLFQLNYFINIHKQMTPASEQQKQKAIEILNKSLDLDSYRVEVWNFYTPHNKDLVLVDLINDSSKKHYLVDLKEGKIIKR
jgi:flagellar basal body-associated protein FliL